MLETPGQPDQELLRRLEVALRVLLQAMRCWEPLLKRRMEVEGPAAARAAAGPRYLVVHGQQDPELLHGLELESTRRHVAVVAAAALG